MDAPDTDSGRTQPSEEELREYARQLRAIPAERIIAETLFSLLNGAQAKLGRHDARLLIDLVAVSLDHSREYLSAELAAQIDRVLGQVRLAQVTAEGHRTTGAVEENDLARVPTPPGKAAGAQAPTATPAQASKLWVPGR